MATPMTAAQLVAQLKKHGVRYAEYKNWRTHNRNHKGAWGPVHGLMVHHTGSDSKDQRELLYAGLASLPGPLSHFGLAQDGTVHLIGWGRANHAGMGDDDVLAAVINETAIPTDNESNTDGNARFYGVEIWYSGSHKMTAAQYASLRKLAAAICDFHGWNEGSVIGHGEWGSPGKWDPGYAPGKMYAMDAVRADIAVTIKAGAPKPVKPTAPKPTPPKAKPVVDLSRVIKARAADLPAATGHKTWPEDVKRVEQALHAEGLLAKQWVDGSWGTKTQAAYDAFRRKIGLKGSDATGAPGMVSLSRLGARHGWTVKP